jgi:hypothetical protein
MVISGAAPLILSAFRRVRHSTSTDAFQTSDACAAPEARAHPYLRRTAVRLGSIIFPIATCPLLSASGLLLAGLIAYPEEKQGQARKDNSGRANGRPPGEAPGLSADQ